MWQARRLKVGVSDATLTTITYDGDGKRRQYEDSAGLRKFVWDGENILPQTDSGGTTNRDYTYNPQPYGELISQSNLFHHYDALGSTDRLTDTNEDTDTSYLYKAFGEQTILSGSDPNRFTWVGKLGYYRQPDTSDYWVRARVYRPTIGKWVRRDPVRSAIPSERGVPAVWLRSFQWSSRVSSRIRQHYMYSRNAPLNRVDPSGLFCIHFAGNRCIGTTCAGDPRCRPRKKPCPSAPPEPPQPPPPKDPCANTRNWNCEACNDKQHSDCLVKAWSKGKTNVVCETAEKNAQMCCFEDTDREGSRRCVLTIWEAAMKAYD